MKKYSPTKWFGILHVFLYRLSGGRIGGKMGRFNVALLTTKGRKSGKSHTIPLGYFADLDGYIVVASNGGSPHHPAWYYNLKNDPQATFQALDKIMPVSAHFLSGDDRAQAWQRITTSVPMYAEYAKEAGREIPLVLLQLKE